MDTFHKISPLFLLFAVALTGLYGCRNLIYDDNNDCNQFLHIHFYSKTPCQEDSIYIGPVSNLMVFALDHQGKVVDIVNKKNVDITKDYTVELAVREGYYNLIAWTGLDKNFAISDVIKGKSTQKDILTKLKTENGRALLLNNSHVYIGRNEQAVKIEPYNDAAAVNHDMYLNLSEMTYKVKVTVDLDESVLDKLKSEDIEVRISSANGTYAIDGNMPLQNAVLQYPSQIELSQSSSVATYYLMDLKIGYHNTIKVLNKRNGEEIYSGDLLGNILLDTDNVNLDCEHDLSVRFLIKDKCKECETYAASCIWVNNWVIHSYKTILTNY